jgi:spore coat protein U-like protein
MKTKFKQSDLKIAITSILLVGSIGLSSASYAGSDTENLSVSSSVGEACNITTSELSFDPYTGTELDGTGAVSHNCTHSLSADITLGVGLNQNGGTAAAPVRRMKHGSTDYLNYLLFSDTNRSTIWGNDGSSDKTITGAGTSESVTIFGRITAGQTVPAGAYSDTVAVTITF